MKNNERILDIESTGNFDKNEIKNFYAILDNSFKSIEYHIIFHFTNEELYYNSHEIENLEENADFQEETEKGKIYCFN